MSDYANVLFEKRHKAWEAAKGLLDRAAEEKRELTSEEREAYDRANEDIDRLGTAINEIVEDERKRREDDTYRETLEGLIKPTEQPAPQASFGDALRHYFRTGEGDKAFGFDRGGLNVDLAPAYEFTRQVRAGASPEELRVTYSDTGSAGSLIPTDFVRELYQFMEAESAVRQVARIIPTSGGNPIEFPRVASHSIGTQVIAQGTTVGGTDATYAKMSLSAYRAGELTRLGNDTIQDAAFPIESFVAENIGRALGRLTDTWYVTGNGSTQPNGVVTASSVGAYTGGSLIEASFETLIDLQHSVVASYRTNGVWLMDDATAADLRKIRADAGGTEGPFIWQPSAQVGQPDVLLGKRAYTDTNFAAQGSAAKAIAFGDFRAYYVRDAGGVRVERSTERYFDSDETAIRGIFRTDADLIDTAAIKVSQQLVSP